MSTASLIANGVGFSSCMGSCLSQPVMTRQAPKYHSLFGARPVTKCDSAGMADKNAGPNYLKAWREFRGLTQAELAEKVGTNQNMIGYLESGERGLSAKWLRKLAPALKTEPGHLLDHDPESVSADIFDIWMHADTRQRRQIADIAKTIVRTGTED